MPNQNYVVVGSEVDNIGYWLLPDGTIQNSGGPNAVALNVEFVGDLLVKLSRLGPKGVTPTQLAAYEDQVKHALTVRDYSDSAGGTTLSAADEAKILANTALKIVFEERAVQDGHVDQNVRLLIVPSDRTLKLQQDKLQQGATVGFPPPLTYELDAALMLASRISDIMGMVQRFEVAGPNGWTKALQTALETHMNAELTKAISFPHGPKGSIKNAKNEIMKSPMRSFHRSVGVYATNMCR